MDIKQQSEPKGPQAARWRQRKFRVLERFAAIPADLLPGCAVLSATLKEILRDIVTIW